MHASSEKRCRKERNGSYPDRSPIQALRKAHELVASHGLLPASRGGDRPAVRTLTEPYLRRVLRMAFLEPDIQQAILDGAQPSGLRLKQITLPPIPFCWEDQRRAFGFDTRTRTAPDRCLLPT